MLSAFPLAQVRLLDGPFKHAQEQDHQYLLALDPDRFLHNFRLNAGLPSAAEPLGNWEAPASELRGHATGHYLSACSLMYASTGDPELKRRIDYMVAELAVCQAAARRQGFHAGYLAAFPESFFDRVDAGKKVWAPWYTMHKIMAGLLDAHENGHNAQALVVLNQLADWVKFRVDRLPVEQFQASLNTEHGGMNEVLANLSAVTHNPDQLRLAQAFNHHAIFAPLARGEDQLDGRHGNTQIPKIIGAVREYELTGDPVDRRMAEFFWQRVALHRSFIFGGNTDAEHFFPVNSESDHLTQTTGETCNTYNMLKLTRHLFAWSPSAAVVLVPLYRIVEQHYNVYWKLYDAAGWEKFYAAAEPQESARLAAQSRVLDAVWAGWAGDETAHHLRAEQSRALGINNCLARTTDQGGFSWTLQTVRNEPTTLRVGHAGSSSPVFDVIVSGRPIAEEQFPPLAEGHKPSAIIKTSALLADISGDRDAVEIRFAGEGSTGTGRVIFCELSRNP